MYKKQIILIGLTLILCLTTLLAFSSELRSQIAYIKNEDMWSETSGLNNDYKIVSGSTISKTFHQDNPVNDIWVETSDAFEKKEQADIGASHIMAVHTEISFDDERYDEAASVK